MHFTFKLMIRTFFSCFFENACYVSYGTPSLMSFGVNPNQISPLLYFAAEIKYKIIIVSTIGQWFFFLQAAQLLHSKLFHQLNRMTFHSKLSNFTVCYFQSLLISFSCVQAIILGLRCYNYGLLLRDDILRGSRIFFYSIVILHILVASGSNFNFIEIVIL